MHWLSTPDMPVFVEDPAQFSKDRLKSELIAHNVDLPPPESKKHAYVELYLKHVRTNNTDFSSDEEEDHPSGSAKKEEAAEMVDLGLLTDDQLKAKLLQYGVKAGPIVASTRALYEKKLKRLLDSSEQASQHRVNGTRDAGRFSDTEEEDESVEDEDKNSESEQLQSETVSWTETSKIASSESVTDVLSEMFPDTARTPTGIYATKRRPIRGAAGRPVQYKYPEMPLLSPTTLERQEIQQRVVPLWVQIVVFLLVVCLLYLIYSSMEEPLSNPFTALLEVWLDIQNGHVLSVSLLFAAQRINVMPAYAEAFVNFRIHSSHTLHEAVNLIESTISDERVKRLFRFPLCHSLRLM
uniref:Peptidase M20 domain containing 1, tandem duplicate 2 n=1 Tax=Cyprinus carpio TaxID=7962 RepID=A0A8C1W6T8_CYPCA